MFKENEIDIEKLKDMNNEEIMNYVENEVKMRFTYLDMFDDFEEDDLLKYWGEKSHIYGSIDKSKDEQIMSGFKYYKSLQINS